MNACGAVSAGRAWYTGRIARAPFVAWLGTPEGEPCSTTRHRTPRVTFSQDARGAPPLAPASPARRRDPDRRRSRSKAR